MRCLICTLLLLSGATAHAQTEPPQLDLNSIYGGNRVRSRSFSGQWEAEGHHYVIRKRAQDDGDHGTEENQSALRTFFRVDSLTDEESPIFEASQLTPPDRTEPLNVESYTFSQNNRRVLLYTNSKRVWRRNTRGDYWVLSLESGTLRQLGGDWPESTLMFAKFSPDGNSVAYVYDRNVYVEDCDSGQRRQLTSTDRETIINGTSDWVNEEELSIRDGFRWSPDGRQIAFWQFDTQDVPQMTMIDNTSDWYPKLITFTYPKAGQQNSSVRVGVVDVERGTTKWAALPGDRRQHYVARIEWTPEADNRPAELIIQHLNRLQNTNTVYFWNTSERDLRKVLIERDDAWVDVHDEMFWLSDGMRFTWVSEADGWRRIYLVDQQTGDRTAITPGGVDAIELLRIDEDNQLAWVMASPQNATQRYLYAAALDGSGWRRVSPENQQGTHSYRISADGRAAVHTFSNLTTPPVISMISLPDHKVVKVLEDNNRLREFVAATCLAPTTMGQTSIGEAKLDHWKIGPTTEGKHPLIVYVYGEPAGTTVRDTWMGSNFLWYQMLAQQGYVIMSFDNRGTPAPKGRAWRKSIYRRIGINAVADQAAAVRQAIQDHPEIDPAKIGVWGWSGGGSMTLNAMFHHNDLYRVGVSVAPVPDQRGYDTIYQERYMGLPQDNAEGYHDGSSIHFCDQLAGDLLLIHGTGDDNCHYATMERLIDKLIENNRQFDMLAYPNRTHAIREGRNTSLHLRTAITRYFLEHLPAR